MAHLVIKLPDVGEGTAQAELSSWLVKVGEVVSEDQNLAEVTTDKATVEIPSPSAGRVVALHGAPGDVIPVGSRLIELEIDGSQATVDEQVSTSDKVAAADASPIPATETVSPAPVAADHRRILASPAVRDRAKDLGINLAQVVGTGAGARVLHKDLDGYLVYRQRSAVAETPLPARGHAATDTFDTVKIVGVRRKIAERMEESKRHIPHYSYVEEVDVTSLENLRLHLIARRPDKAKLSILPFILMALVKALPEFPQANAHYDEDTGTVRQYHAVHAGIATQTDKGLMVPVVFHAEAKNLWALNTEIAQVAEAARQGTADRKILSGSTITITSLGKLGGIATTPIINRPEVAIIGVNKVSERPFVHGGAVVVRHVMNLSSSFDHRIVDGWVAASLVQKIKALLEQPATLFMDSLVDG